MFNLITYNIQAGIGTDRPHKYLTRFHHQLFHSRRKIQTLKSIAKVISPFDIVCLQEVDLGGRRSAFESQVDLIGAHSDHAHIISQENRRVRNISRHGNAILSRFEPHAVRDFKLPGKVAGRGALIVDFDLDTQVTVACIHLSLGVQDQIMQLQAIGEQIDWSRDVYVCGDFNCNVHAAPVRQFCEAFDARLLTTPSHKTYPSWAPRMAIDHIITNGADKRLNVTVPDIRFSDHKPVTLEKR